MRFRISSLMSSPHQLLYDFTSISSCITSPTSSRMASGISSCLASGGRKQINLRTAVIAAYRLGVIPAGPGPVIFLRAGSAHGKHLHAGSLPVIGEGVQNGHSGSRGTVDKRDGDNGGWRVVHLLLALLADSDIRGNIDLTACFCTLDDGKRIEGRRIRDHFFIDLEDGGTAGRLFAEKGLKAFDLPGCTLCEDLDIGSLLQTLPRIPAVRAWRSTVGRNPTPCTIPYTRKRTVALLLIGLSSFPAGIMNPGS